MRSCRKKQLTFKILNLKEDETKSMPIKKKTITGAELAEKLKNKNLISEENAEDWLNIIKEVRSEQKLPDIKWD